jgi:uncharacterized protein YcbK (DUF882 family)
MADVSQLQARRDKLREREQKVDAAIKDEKADLKHLAKELDEERKQRDELMERRKELKEDLEKEIAADEQGEGDKPEEWEDWVETRRDELADMIDSCEARMNRLAERMVKSKQDLSALTAKDKQLEQRIALVTRRIERKADKSNDLTKDFSMAEFDCNNGTPVPEYMRPHLKDLCERHLQPLRDAGGTVNINSGYRTTAYNAAIGGASNSYHVYTYRKKAPAVDHTQSGRSAGEVANWHDAHDKFDGMGRYSSFCHGDDRGYYSRWTG